jgi:branched-chain amino acid transport system permease protein
VSEPITPKVRRWRLRAPGTGAPELRDSFRRAWPWWALVVLAGIVFPAVQNTDYVFFLAGGVGVYCLVGIGVNLLYGLGGQASLGQGAVVAVGAYTTGILVVHHGWNMWAAIVASLVSGAVTGVVMGLPALRLSTWYFALTTLAFAQVVLGLVNYFADLTGGTSGLVGVIAPVTTAALYWIIVAVNAVGLAVYWTFANSRLGRALISVKEGGEAGTASGVRAPYIKLIAFALSGAYAGVGGALFAFEQQVISPEEFDTYFSIFFIVVIVAGGVGRWLGPVVGALAFFAVPEFLASLASWRMVIYGAALLAFMAVAPDGIIGAVEAIWLRLRARRRSTVDKTPDSAADAKPDAPSTVSAAGARAVHNTAIAHDEDAARLEITDVRLSFGGVKALQGVTMTLAPGRVHGLVGPNGSGKTTLLNVISGLYLPSSGSVRLDGAELVGSAPAMLVRRGIARTFQTPRLLKELSVWVNVMLGAYSGERATAAEVLARLPRSRREARRLGAKANEMLDALGLAGRAGTRAADMPHGLQRMIEIARALMVEPRVLLLDEPAAGLSAEELRVLDQVVRDLGGGGMSVLVVEHHIGWVRDLCEHVTVLDQGQVVTAGDPEAVFAHPRVRETYLGAVVG